MKRFIQFECMECGASFTLDETAVGALDEVTCPVCQGSVPVEEDDGDDLDDDDSDQDEDDDE